MAVKRGYLVPVCNALSHHEAIGPDDQRAVLLFHIECDQPADMILPDACLIRG